MVPIFCVATSNETAFTTLHIAFRNCTTTVNYAFNNKSPTSPKSSKVKQLHKNWLIKQKLILVLLVRHVDFHSVGKYPASKVFLTHAEYANIAQLNESPVCVCITSTYLE